MRYVTTFSALTPAEVFIRSAVILHLHLRNFSIAAWNLHGIHSRYVLLDSLYGLLLFPPTSGLPLSPIHN